MKLPFTASGVLIAFLVSALPLKAELIPSGDPRYGAHPVILDTATGLAWLNLPATRNLSYDQGLAALQPGGPFAGFRYASQSEVLTLFQNAGIQNVDWIPESSPSLQPVLAFLSLIGPTGSQDGRPEAIGVSGTSVMAGLRVPLGLDFFYMTGVPGYAVVGFPGAVGPSGFGETFSDSGYSSWLVQPIPEPASLTLLLISGLFILARQLRRNAGTA